MTADGRVQAWLMAFKHLESAGNLLRENPEIPAAGALHDCLVRRAEIYSRLASAPDDVGIGAGTWLHEQEKRDREANDRMRDTLRKVVNGRP